LSQNFNKNQGRWDFDEKIIRENNVREVKEKEG
jgi:hypothetical protein